MVVERGGSLYGRDRAIDLVREFLIRPEIDGVPRSREVPVLVFTANRGGGKTALLKEIAGALDGQAPFARIDCENTDATMVPQLLSTLTFELNRKCGRYGRLAFPRFIVGQLIAAQELDQENRARARRQVEQALEEFRRIDRLRAFLEANAPQVLSAVPGVSGIPGSGAAMRYLPDLVLRGLISGPLGRRVVLGEGQDWYGHQGRGLRHDPIDALVTLNIQVRNPKAGANESEANELLWAAFLADLRDDFRRGRRADEWPFNCAVLIDNIDATIGLDFLNELNSARRGHAAHAPADFDPLTIVATSRGALARRSVRLGESVPGTAEASYSDSLRHRHDRPRRTWYQVLLPDLSRTEVKNMVADTGLHAGRVQSVRDVVHRFTGGHPGSTRTVIDALGERPSDATDLRLVLDGPAASGLSADQSTAEELLLS